MSFDPDVIYNNLSMEEQKAIDEQVLKELEEENPHFKNAKVGYMKNTLMLMKRRQIICNKHRGKFKPPATAMVIDENEKDIEIRELKEELNEVREQLKARDRKIQELEFALDILKEGAGDNNAGKHAA